MQTILPHRPQAGSCQVIGNSEVDWVIVGGESGYGSRPCDMDWIRNVISQCQAQRVPVSVKQRGMKPYIGDAKTRLKQLDKKKGGWMNSWPEDLRVRQMPRVEA